jgi:hypothetical protein
MQIDKRRRDLPRLQHIESVQSAFPLNRIAAELDGDLQTSKGAGVSIDELRVCQALLLEYMAFFLAERSRIELSSASSEEVDAIEAHIASLIAGQADPAESGPDVLRLATEWSDFQRQADALPRASKGRVSKAAIPAFLGNPTSHGWLMRALERRGLRAAPALSQ